MFDEFEIEWSGWEDLRIMDPRAAAVVIVRERLEGPGWEHLVELSERSSRPPMILVTGFAKRNLAYLAHLRVDQVLCLEDVPQQLGEVLKRYVGVDPLHDATASLTRSSLPEAFRRALVHVCRAARPPRTVARWAFESGLHRSMLYLYFDAYAPGVTPKDFLDWVAVLRVSASSNGAGWVRQAARDGVGEDALGRATRRLLGRSPGEAARLPPPALLAEFRERVLWPMLHSSEAFAGPVREIARVRQIDGRSTPDSGWSADESGPSMG